MKMSPKKKNYIIIFSVTLILAMVTGLLIFLFISYTGKISKTENMGSYDYYVAMITDDNESSFWKSVYDSAAAAGLSGNTCVEVLAENFPMGYSKSDLLDIAVAAGVDGIILEADESEEMTDAINRAADAGIPVVTAYSDNTKSERISYVGIGNYNLGREYGDLLVNLFSGKTVDDDHIDVTILMDANAEDSGQNVVVAAIQETLSKELSIHPYTCLPFEITIFQVDSTNSFSVEESVRSLFVQGDSLPDAIVCLSDTDTTSVYQTVVDYNEVGNVNILGYYDSDAILKGIERNVIYATVSIDTEQMGEFCVDALNEYRELGNTSQYFTADIKVITKDNVSAYSKGGNLVED